MPLRLFQLSGNLAAGILSLLATGIVHVEPASAAPSVNIAMNAAFPAPPYLVELLLVLSSRTGLFGDRPNIVAQGIGGFGE